MGNLDSDLPRRRLVYPALAERREEQRWLAECGLTRERLAPVKAPSDLTALVMARITADPAATLAAATHRSPAGIRREGLPAAAGTLVIALLLLAASVIGFFAFAPGDALQALGAVLTFAVGVVGLLRQALLLLASAFSNDVVILACAVVPAAALLFWYRTVRDPASLTREA